MEQFMANFGDSELIADLKLQTSSKLFAQILIDVGDISATQARCAKYYENQSKYHQDKRKEDQAEHSKQLKKFSEELYTSQKQYAENLLHYGENIKKLRNEIEQMKQDHLKKYTEQVEIIDKLKKQLAKKSKNKV